MMLKLEFILVDKNIFRYVGKMKIHDNIANCDQLKC